MTTLVDKFSSLIDYANDRRDTSYTNLTDIIANELNAEQTPVTHIPSATIEERTQSLMDYANEKCNTSYDNLTDVILNDLKGQRTYSIEEKEPYIYRKTANGLSVGGQKQETIVGGSIVWNQIANAKNTQGTIYGITSIGNSNNNSISLSGTANSSRYLSISSAIFTVDAQANHVLLMMASLLSGSYSGNLFLFGDSANVFTFASPTIKKPSKIANKQLYIQVVADTAYDFEIITNVFDLTKMFGTEVADAIYAMEQASAGSGVAIFRSMFPNDYYEYNAGELKSVEGLQKHVNRDADEHIVGQYLLDSDIVLRGIPKFANGQVYFDGDTYESDGKVTRRYGIVDLGTMTWSYNSTYDLYVSQSLVNTFKRPLNGATKANALCSKYEIVIQDRNILDKGISFWTNGSISYFNNNEFADATAFKAAMSGVYLVYELATPTSESADPFTNPQKVSKYGTEEYVTTGLVPVGHDTKYSTD